MNTLKIALAELNFHTGNFEFNSSKIIDSIEKAKKEKADLIVFAELAICGYPPRDFLDFEHFIDLCHQHIHEIASHCDSIACILGAPSVNPSKAGKNLFNSAYFIENQRVKKIINKTLLPTYDVFDEYRYFESNKEFEIIDFKNTKIALTICEDTWNLGRFELYPQTPMDELIKQNPDLMINIAASPFSYNHQDNRLEMLRLNVKRYHLPILYVNHIGAQTELIFDGNSLAMNASGEIVHQTKPFEEALDFVEFNGLEFQSLGNNFVANRPSELQQIQDGLVLGIRDYFKKLNFKKAILGLSGGIDSALVAVLAQKALGKENVHALLMPSEFSSDHSINDAVELSKNLGISYDIISIQDDFKSLQKTLNPHFKDLPFNVAEENIQSRLRGILLMGFCNKFGYILLNTSNKSELAVGYGTLYGDMAGGISVIGDVYKTQVFDLCKFINLEKEIIPENIISKPPSAELRPDQKDSDSLPDYAILDEILMEYIENQQGPEQIIEKGFDEKLVKRILRLMNLNEYKRHQTPPILRISPKAFGMGRRMPIVAKYLA